MNADELTEAKTRAEIAKLEAETDAVRKTHWTRIGDFLKVLGAVTATMAAGYAAITTYRITQLETRLAIAEKQQVDEARMVATRARDEALRQLRVSIAAGREAERNASLAAAEMMQTRQQALVARRERDLAWQALARERAATEEAVQRRVEAERQLADTWTNLAQVRSDLVMFESASVT